MKKKNDCLFDYSKKERAFFMMDKKDIGKLGFASKQIHAGEEPNAHGALTTPIYQTSTFVFDSAEQGGRRFALEEEGYIYTRLGNPTTTVVEKKLAALEGGEACVSFSSGMGAVSSCLWAALKSGDHIVAGKTLYGCTFSFMNNGLTRFGVDVSFVDMRCVENVKQAIRSNTRIVYIETPANPNMYLADIKEIAKASHDANPDIIVVVDNTYMTPYLQKPLALGADVVLHSATKYLNGHGDVIAGFVVGKKEFMDEVRFVGLKDMTGAVVGPFESYLIERGMKTLDIRMEKHCANAQKVAEFLEGHPKITSIAFPGLKSFPQYELAKKQMALPGAMIACTVKGGLEAGKCMINSVRLATIAVSLGDVQTLIQHPASMTHSPYTPEQRAASDIAEGLLRISIGLEDADDIIDDFAQALDKIK